ncbi:MAG: DNA starvation/stationary phase protection protein [Rickettsiaceae bacterium]|nr:DNA starvation/stationary phase protection protein [Rickettsiaceae bacterium]
MSNDDVIQSLKLLLADSYALYLKTQNYHWNIIAHNFYSLHMMFEGQYEELAEAIDEIAERIRALGEKVPGSFAIFDQNKTVQDPDEQASTDKMLQHLADDQDTLVNILKKVVSLSEAADDPATADLAIKRIGVHQKNAWQLRSYLEFDLVETQLGK